jgi:predicted O-methyltransferase YrrM
VQAIKLEREVNQVSGLIRDLVRELDDIAGLEAIWKNGVVHPGGPHYRLKGMLGPISLGEDECIVLGRVIEGFKPKGCFIIGNGFGMGSAFIAKQMELHGGRSVVSLDNKSEGDGDRCYETSIKIRERMDCRLLKNKWGWSPHDIEMAANGESYDLILIDGDHSHPQVTRDFKGVQSIAHEGAIVCWHYYWLDGVAESVAEAQRAGYHCLKINSSCEIVFGTKCESDFQRMKELFSSAEIPVRRRRPLAHMKLYNALLSGVVKTYLTRNRQK